MGREPPSELPDRVLWQRSRATDVTVDDAAIFLDLAALTDESLDPDERERVAEWLAQDAEAAQDVAAARALASAASREPASAAIVARAGTLVGGDGPRPAEIIPFRQQQATRTRLHSAARWGVQWASLAAAVVVAGWLGFTLGMDTSTALTRNDRAADDSLLQELLGPAPGTLRDLTDGA